LEGIVGPVGIPEVITYDRRGFTGSGNGSLPSRLSPSADPGAVEVTGPRAAFRCPGPKTVPSGA